MVNPAPHPGPQYHHLTSRNQTLHSDWLMYGRDGRRPIDAIPPPPSIDGGKHQGGQPEINELLLPSRLLRRRASALPNPLNLRRYGVKGGR